MELIKRLKKIEDSAGFSKTVVNFYLQLDNGNRVAISPKYYGKTGKNTYKELETIARLEK